MGDIPQEEAIPRLEAALERLAPVEIELAQIQNDLDAKVAALRAEAGVKSDPLTTSRNEIISEVAAIIAEHRGFVFTDGSGKPRKSVVLRGGEVSAKLAPESLETDDKQLEKELRKLGLWYVNSKPQPRKVDKAKIKKNRSLVAKLSDLAARFTQKENLYIRLPKQTVEVKEFKDPLKRTISTTSN